jgi:hypothetical protein
MQIVRTVFLVLFGALFILMLTIFLTRISLPYNEQGRFFTGDVVYKDYAIYLYGILCLIFGLLAAGLVWELNFFKRNAAK